MKKTLLLTSLMLLTPVVTFAQFGEISTYMTNISVFINSRLVPLVFAIAFLVFIWGVFKYFILGGGESDKREEGRQLMLYAIIGFVLMVSIWGIVNILSQGLGFRQQDLQDIPNVPGVRGNVQGVQQNP